MSVNIAEAVQKRLQFPPLQKIDPNTQSKEEGSKALKFPVTQAAIVTALAGLYKITRTTEGCVRLLLTGKNASWLEEVYGDNLEKTFHHVSEYTHASVEEVEKLVRDCADTAILILHEQLADHINVESFKNFMSGQRDHILVFLPAGMQLGEMLHDPGLDDNTNKMEGPVSTLMHKIENIFSEGQ
jgi:quinol monooxygenase YgiN